MIGVIDTSIDRDLSVLSASPGKMKLDNRRNLFRPCMCYRSGEIRRLSHRCPQCWRVWGVRRFWRYSHAFKARTKSSPQFWYAVGLHFRFHANAARRSDMLNSWLDSIKNKHKITYARIWHKTKDEIHVHLVIASTSAIDPEWARMKWRRVMNKYGDVKYVKQDAYFKPAHSWQAYLAYWLGVNANHSRQEQPWGDLTGKILVTNAIKSPVKTADPLQPTGQAPLFQAEPPIRQSLGDEGQGSSGCGPAGFVAADRLGSSPPTARLSIFSRRCFAPTP